MTLRVHELCDGAQLTVSTDAGRQRHCALCDLSRAGHEIRLERRGPLAPWRVLMVGWHTISASPGLVIPSPDGAVGSLVMNIAFTVILLGNTPGEIMSAK